MLPYLSALPLMKEYWLVLVWLYWSRFESELPSLYLLVFEYLLAYYLVLLKVCLLVLELMFQLLME